MTTNAERRLDVQISSESALESEVDEKSKSEQDGRKEAKSGRVTWSYGIQI